MPIDDCSNCGRPHALDPESGLCTFCTKNEDWYWKSGALDELIKDPLLPTSSKEERALRTKLEAQLEVPSPFPVGIKRTRHRAHHHTYPSYPYSME